MDYKGLNFFGSYLREKGVITQQALQDAIAFQEESNRRIGELARERGYLSKEQTEDIFEEQKRVDQPFGTIALKRKYLTRGQLDDLLFAQTVFSTHLGEALLIKGYITPEQFSEELQCFRDAQMRREEELSNFFNGLPDKDVLRAIVASTNRAYVRFAGRELKVDSVCVTPESLFEMLFTVTLDTVQKGAVTCDFYISHALAAEILEGVITQKREACDSKCLELLFDFFNIVSRYLQVAFAELRLEVRGESVTGGRLDEPVAVPADSGLTVQFATPVGPMILHASLELSEEPSPCAKG